MKRSVVLRGCVLLAVVFVETLVLAAPLSGPPEEAFAACNGKEAGAACTVSFRGLIIEGQCVPWQDKALVCRPATVP
jgi:hypothetical protein